MRLPLIVTLALPLLAASAASAAILVRDDFSGYTEGAPPTGLNHGTGWIRGWQQAPGVDALIRKTDPAPRVEISGTDTVRALVRRLETPAGVGGAPVYFRTDFSIEASEAEINQLFAGWYFADAQGYRPGLAAAVIGFRGEVAARADEKTTAVRGRLEPGRRHTLVTRLDQWNASTRRFMRVTVWLDPDPSKPADTQPLQASHLAAEGCGPVEVLFLRIHNLNKSRLHFYEVRFADRWEDACSGG